MPQLPVVITSTNLSHAWGKGFLALMDAPIGRAAPMVVSISCDSDDGPMEVAGLRETLDDTLKTHGCFPSAVSGTMVFPFEAWLRRGRPPANEFCAYCIDRLLPRLKALSALNRRGTYFERLMAFRGADGDGRATTTNQVAAVIQSWRRSRGHGKRLRTSALQLAVFDPAKDHGGGPRQGFPCLQQVGLRVDVDDALSLDAFYPAQYIFERAYGNYLGLCYLGCFMAQEMGVRFNQMNAYIADPKLSGGTSKTDLRALEAMVRHSMAVTA